MHLTHRGAAFGFLVFSCITSYSQGQVEERPQSNQESTMKTTIVGYASKCTGFDGGGRCISLGPDENSPIRRADLIEVDICPAGEQFIGFRAKCSGVVAGLCVSFTPDATNPICE